MWGKLPSREAIQEQIANKLDTEDDSSCHLLERYLEGDPKLLMGKEALKNISGTLRDWMGEQNASKEEK